jgi:hypothetical protein
MTLPGTARRPPRRTAPRDRELVRRAIEDLRSSTSWQAWLRVRARTGLRHGDRDDLTPQLPAGV